jgi:hypothetical protein
MINGDKGRLELEVVESSFRLPKGKGEDAAGAVHGEAELPNAGHQRITLHPLWQTAQDVPFESGVGGHGGGDEAMLDQIFGPRDGVERKTAVDRLSANQIDGALAMAVGLAANESFKTGKMVKIDELLGVVL